MRELGQSPKKKRSLIKILAFAFLLLFVLVAVINIFNLEKTFLRGPTTVVQLIIGSGLESDRGRVNVLLLGVGGAGHEGPYLSDTIILASISEDGDDVALVSIPRDLWIPSLSAKINSAYAFGEERDGQGLETAKKSVREIFDLPIHYAVRVDFAGFEKAIDLVDGIDVDVETAFVDPKYPIAGKEGDTCGLEVETEVIDGLRQVIAKDATGSATIVTEENDPFVCRYETISFKSGDVHMDGKTALKFVRSRHGTNGQGSDFARSARQQKVTLAFRDRIFSGAILLDPKTILDLVKTFGASIDTDITDEEVPFFLKLTQKIDPTTVRRVVLDVESKESPLTVGDLASHGGQFVLVPKGNSYRDLAEYVQGEIFKLEGK